MDKNEDLVQTNCSKTLLIRHLPAELSQDEKEDLLKYFGAESVRVFSSTGRLKHTAFATFRSEKSAANALTRLHQLEILDHTLVAEFAKGQDHVTVLKDPPVSDSGKRVKEEKKKQETQQTNIPLIETGVAPSLGLKFQSNPTLKYLYPPPSNGILTNITHALMSVPKFYVQVLHLMNKMNLPCPFGPVTARPPMFELLPPAPPIPMPPPFPPDFPPLPEEAMELSSEEESEYESGDDEDKERIVRLIGLVNQACKRPMRPKTASKRKKPKIKDLLYAPKPDSQSAPVLQPSDVFEQPHPAGPKKIEFHISVPEVASMVEGRGPGTVAQSDDGREVDEKQAAPSLIDEREVAEGFGKLYPSTQESQQQEEHSDNEQDLTSGVISRKELEKGRLSRDEMKRMSVFKNYEPGEPTCRLYVKNIAKQVEEKELKYIYGRYIDPLLEAERNMFDIVLMKEGRMKGQAFVGLPSERSAEKALRETNGYVLYDKPLVVQFARSARPKQDSTDTKRGPKQR
ncbi:RNA-binding protein 40 [Seriola lalandi dorsalis]|uniref:RNA-binding region-containing protein 3 n=1 Tax=Seriola lalandi dorsalis TaxID=1841481 RepID=A0A3B4X195_SERLL|nr:RNA-binding protein 40 [Seriola lalandi dorsalis]XP_023253704.1 RNA-binding protein 40 [Seriola lalandi dorsalis]XP_023253706.1 RNA-binding protein 40 [Seriola lalandi dorsalis]XP_056221082.1 RNA-binding region-containing protein 3 [Seriola aureovittata]XP_056221083.1 RNA-binding region-containing protein 3 [Seriola aureovittata]